MRKIFVIFLLLILGLSESMVAQNAEIEQRCKELRLECDKLRSEINSSKKTSEKISKYKKMLNYFSEMAEMDGGGCWGHEKDSIDAINAKIIALGNKSNGNSIFKTTKIMCSADTGHIDIALKTDKVTLLSWPSWANKEETDAKKTLRFSVEPNQLPYQRLDTISVKNNSTKKIEYAILTQDAAELRALVTEKVGFPQDGGFGFIYVETNDTAWTAKSSVDWVTANVNEYGVSLVCKSNPTKSRRTGTVTVRLASGKLTKSVTISQVIGKTTLSVPTTYVSYDYDGGLKDAVVNCNYDQWSVSSKESWISVSKGYGGIKIECLANSHAESRSGIVTIETDDEEHLVRQIEVKQEAAPAYLYLSDANDAYRSDGLARTIYIPIRTNVADWTVRCTNGTRWSNVSRNGSNQVKVVLSRNDENYSRTSQYEVSGKGKKQTFTVYQPNRGYAGRYNDYFDAVGGDWRIMWFSIDFHGMTTVGDNISIFNARWKPVELSLVNFNLDYIHDGFTANWEPVVRGYMPITRDGKWSAFLGMGAHVCMNKSDHHFLLEFGAEANWNSLMSSRMFFKYNGGVSIGISFDLGTWL